MTTKMDSSNKSRLVSKKSLITRKSSEPGVSETVPQPEGTHFSNPHDRSTTPPRPEQTWRCSKGHVWNGSLQIPALTVHIDDQESEDFCLLCLRELLRASCGIVEKVERLPGPTLDSE